MKSSRRGLVEIIFLAGGFIALALVIFVWRSKAKIEMAQPPDPPAAPTTVTSSAPVTQLAPTETPAVPASRICQYDFEADVDGRDDLVIQGQNVHWLHLDWDPVGLHNENYPATIISGYDHGIKKTSGMEWIPSWPHGTKHGATSSVYSNLIPPFPDGPVSVQLFVETGRGTVKIVQQPKPGNGNTLVVEFDDNAYGDSALYDVQIDVFKAAP